MEEDIVTEKKKGRVCISPKAITPFPGGQCDWWEKINQGRNFCKGEVATFIAVDIYSIVFEIHWPVQVAMTKGGYNCTAFWPQMSSSTTNMWRNYTGVIRLKYSNCDHVGWVCWWQNKMKTEWNIFLSSSSPVNTPNQCGHWLLCLSRHSCSSFCV